MTQSPPREERGTDLRWVGPTVLTGLLLLLSGAMWVTGDLVHAEPSTGTM